MVHALSVRGKLQLLHRSIFFRNHKTRSIRPNDHVFGFLCIQHAHPRARTHRHRHAHTHTHNLTGCILTMSLDFCVFNTHTHTQTTDRQTDRFCINLFVYACQRIQLRMCPYKYVCARVYLCIQRLMGASILFCI